MYREVLCDTALNFRSVCLKDRGLDWKTMTEQLEKLDEYFEGKVDYSVMWSNLILNYFKTMIKREEGTFTVGDLWEMYKNSSKKTKARVKRELMGSLKRKLRR